MVRREGCMGYDVTSYFRSAVIAVIALWVEFLQNGLREDHEILRIGTVSPTNLPDMASLTPSGRL